MVQLKVYDGSDQYFLDLFPTEPIKLTLSIEDITNADARSTFSRTFRVPNTKKNNQFFKNAFLVDGIDYDVTVKKEAHILYNGAEFKIGHIRLQKIYVNKMENSVEYEIVFLGETRDFASALGEKTLAELDLSMYEHTLNYANVRNSWLAYPEGNENDGLFNGDILYPLINFGEGATGEIKIEYGTAAEYFNSNNANAYITANRFKPMIRAKALWDRIFEEAGFTYSSAIADANDFRQLYVSAFGNEAISTQSVGQANFLDVALSAPFPVSGSQAIQWDVENVDPADNYNPTTGFYTVPATGTYRINLLVDGSSFREAGSGGVLVELRSGPTVLASNIVSGATPFQSFNFTLNVNQNFVLSAGSLIFVLVSEQGDVSNTAVSGAYSYWRIPEAPGQVDVALLLDNTYKQIDFVKDMLTKFRLVMAPDKTDPRKFVVEPWVDYIATGDVHDWSPLLDESRDLQIEPLFFTQSARLKFEDKEDADWLNDLNIKKYKETFGTLFIDSGNELLKETREIKTNFAPTPITQIEGAPESNFLIPSIHSHETDNNFTQHTPIKPVTRLLFYNGLFQQGPTSAFPNNDPRWYFYDDGGAGKTAQYSFPKVSYWQDFDEINGPSATTINLNWQIERGYANDVPGYNFNYQAGISMYTRFWKPYIDSLYSKFARRVTGYFALTAEDLFDFTFDDVIFVNGTYYQPEKLTDVVVGERSLVKVDLIKLLNYGVSVIEGSGGTGGDTGGGTGGDTGGGTSPAPSEGPTPTPSPSPSPSPSPATPLDVQFTSWQDPTVCGGIGGYQFTITGGTPNYTIVRKMNGTTVETIPNTNFTTFSRNAYAGYYEVIVTDSTGATASDQLQLQDPCGATGPSGG